MNRKLKSVINKYCYKIGLKHYEQIRNGMLLKADALAKAGKPNHEIFEIIGIPAHQDDDKTRSLP